MAYSSESCMVSKETAKKIRIREIIINERREKLKMIFEEYQKACREAEGWQAPSLLSHQ